MSHRDRLEFGLWKGGTRDVTGTLIFPDTSGGTLLIAVILERQLKSKGRKYSSVSWRNRQSSSSIASSDFRLLWGCFYLPASLCTNTESAKKHYGISCCFFHISSEFGGNKMFTSKQTYLWGKDSLSELKTLAVCCGEKLLCIVSTQIYIYIYPPAHVASYFSGSHFGISAGVSLPSGTVEHLPH